MGATHSARFDVREDDMIALYKRTMRNSDLVRSLRWRNLRTTAIAWLIVVGGLASASYWNAPNAAAGLRAVGICVATYAVVGPMYAWWSLSRVGPRIDRVIERAVRTGKIHVSAGPAEVRLDEERIALIEPDGTLAKPWGAVKSVEDGADGVYFAFTDGLQFRVPARAFGTDEERTEFVGAARERVDAVSFDPDARPR